MTCHGQLGNAVCCKNLRLGCTSDGRFSGGLAAVVWGLLLTQVLGCASPGPPRPPSLKLPQPVTDLAAERIGDQVVLRWTTPAKTTDGLMIKGSMSAAICRQVGLASAKTTAMTTGAPASACVPVERVVVHAGASRATDVLTGPLAADPVQLLVYTVGIENTAGQAAGGSNAAYAASGTAAGAVEDLRATAERDGARLEWRRGPAAMAEAGVELKRERVVLAAAGGKTTDRSAGESKASQSKGGPATEEQPDEVLLRAGQPRLGAETQQMAGTIDATAKMGESYRYTAQRVRVAQVGRQRLEMRSVASAPVTLVMRDVFPPSAPTGLAAVATSLGAGINRASIDLSWEPVTDVDLAGYVVYRQRVGDTGGLLGPVERLTEKLVLGPGFSDLTAVPGQQYAYRVTAVDHAGNESSASADVQEQLRTP